MISFYPVALSFEDGDYDDEVSCDLPIGGFFEAINPENPYYRARAEQRKVDRGVVLHNNVQQWLKAI